MATEPAKGESGTSLIEKGMGAFERAWEVLLALRLICAVMFFDIAMILHTGHGLWQWSASDSGLLNNAGWLAMVVVSFSCIVAIVMPLLLSFIKQVGWLIEAYLSGIASSRDKPPYQRPLGCVSASDFHKLALNERDEFLLHIYKAHRQAKASREYALDRLAGLAVTAILAAFLDWMLTHWVPGAASLMDVVVDVLGSWTLIIVILALLWAGGIAANAWFSEIPRDLIYYPPLDRELRDKERKAKAGNRVE